LRHQTWKFGFWERRLFKADGFWNCTNMESW